MRRAYIAASHACHAVKGVKVYVVNEDSVWSAVEYLVTTVDAVTLAMLKRHLEMVWYGWIEFRDKMAELQAIHVDDSRGRLAH